MKKITLLLLCVGCLHLNAQTTKELYDAFKGLPFSMTNDELKAIVTPEKKVDDKLCYNLNKSYVAGSEEYYSIGKVNFSDKVYHYFYGVVTYNDRAKNDFVMQVACSSFNISSGEMVKGGLQNYLCMVGRDALIRESSYSYAGGVITFVMKSTDQSNVTTTETVKYKAGKFLEFLSRE